jgi:hypothetical protein
VSIADELATLDALRQSGALTDAEFQEAKRRLLAPPATPAARPPDGSFVALGQAANRYVDLETAKTRADNVRLAVGLAIGLVVIVVGAVCALSAFSDGNPFGDCDPRFSTCTYP